MTHSKLTVYHFEYPSEIFTICQGMWIISAYCAHAVHITHGLWVAVPVIRSVQEISQSMSWLKQPFK